MCARRRSPIGLAVWLLLALVLSGAGAENAGAQDGDIPDPLSDLPKVEAPAAPPQGIEAIEITGERDLTNVQREAQAITAFDMADLDKLNISNVDGLASNVPGLHVGQQGQAAIITLRGVGTENASLTGESGVAFHVDGVYYGRPAAARTAFYDIEMIDVKRGPQGYEGGKNSTSGTINVKTRDPEIGEFGVDADYLIGNYDRQRSRGMINIPVGESLAARLALFYEERDGYLKFISTPVRDPFTQPRVVRDMGASHDPFDADNFGLRGKLRFSPSDSFDMVFGYSWFKEGGNGPQADLVPLTNQLGSNPCVDAGSYPPFLAPHFDPKFRSAMPLFLACRAVVRQKPYPNPPPRGFKTLMHDPAIEDRDPRKIYGDDSSLPRQDDRYWGFTDTIDWDAPTLALLGDTHVKALLSYQRTQTAFDSDFDASSVQLFPLSSSSKVHEHSAQLEWNGVLAERLEWQTSLFYAREEGDSLTVNRSLGSTFQNGTVTSAASLKSTQSILNRSYGLGLHGSYQLTDTFTASLGGRWIKDEKSSYLRRQTSVAFAEACRPLGNELDDWQATQQLPTCEATFRGKMWGSRLEFRPSDALTFYAGIDRGYKSGGFGLGGVGGYKPEKVWAYSLGGKSQLFDDRLQLNLEGFIYNYQDMQIALIDGTRIRTENTDARMYGWELETRANPFGGLNLRGVVSYLHTETIDYQSLDPATLGNAGQDDRLNVFERSQRTGQPFSDPSLTCADPADPSVSRQCRLIGTSGKFDGLDDFSGNQLSRSPEWKFTFSAEYEIELGRFGSLTPHGQYSWQDDTYFRVFNRDFDLQEAFHKTDAKLIWESPEHMWTAEAFVENIENDAVKDFILIGSRVFSAPPLAWYSAPRFWGFRVGFRY